MTNFWQVKAAALERKIRLQELEQVAKDIDAAYHKALTDNGLDPAKTYRLIDATETIEDTSDGPPA